MSTQEIMTELAKLDRQQLERVESRLHELLEAARPSQQPRQKPIGEVLLEFAGQAQGLPADYSSNINHYLYGVPKRQP